MKKNTLLLIVAICCIGLAMSFTISAYQGQPHYTIHKCIDPTHQLCDGHCECDGLGCYERDTDGTVNYYTKPVNLLRSYQLQIEDENAVTVWDGTRYVGIIRYTGKSQLDRLIDRDND